MLAVYPYGWEGSAQVSLFPLILGAENVGVTLMFS
ncbi:MAG: hypothetical protein RLZZ488_2396 [Pseudomonadota bacterium]|jgi:hypothetical protein